VALLRRARRRITAWRPSSPPVTSRLSDSGKTTTREGKGREGGGSMSPAFRAVMRNRRQRLATPLRPTVTRGGGSMCAEQLADLAAAQDGRITWAQYFRKWGPSL